MGHNLTNIHGLIKAPGEGMGNFPELGGKTLLLKTALWTQDFENRTVADLEAAS